MRVNRVLFRVRRKEDDQLDRLIRDAGFQHSGYFVYYLDRHWYVFRQSKRRINRLTGKPRLVVLDKFLLYSSALTKIREQELAHAKD